MRTIYLSIKVIVKNLLRRKPKAYKIDHTLMNKNV